MSEILISSTGNQKQFCASFISVLWFSAFSWNIYHTFYNAMLQMSLHLDMHIDSVMAVTIVDKFSRWNSI